MNILRATATAERLAVLAIHLLVVGAISMSVRASDGDKDSENEWPRKNDMPDVGLENCWQVSKRVYSGAGPTGAESFEHLAELGFRTVVSVDGMQPDVEAARAAGLRYIHIPIGYGSIPKSAQRQFLSVSKETSGKIYVHCHHGKHRGPSAAAVLCMFEDGRSPESALKILRCAGTSNSYAGLWHSVKGFDRQLIAAEEAVPLVSVARVPPTASTMVAIDQHFEQLRKLAESTSDGSVAPQRLRELSVLAEELFRELARSKNTSRNADLRRRYSDVATLFNAMSKLPEADILRDGGFSKAVDAHLQRIGNACQSCHVTHRN